MLTLCDQGPVVRWLEEGGNHGVLQVQRMCGELLHFHHEALETEVWEAERHRSVQL